MNRHYAKSWLDFYKENYKKFKQNFKIFIQAEISKFNRILIQII